MTHKATMTTKPKVLHIGIASRAQKQARTRAIARGEVKPRPTDPKVWFTSLESLAQVLSSPNQALLELIRRERPASFTALAELAGREQGNLSRTLRTMARYGLVVLTKVDHRVVPEVPYDRFAVDVPLPMAA